eukprot:m.107819 g.107819  ORF g.107819 m.107819 type:complete len:1693 (-) comp9181_c0_seq6:1248-6326(-)
MGRMKSACFSCCYGCGANGNTYYSCIKFNLIILCIVMVAFFLLPFTNKIDAQVTSIENPDCQRITFRDFPNLPVDSYLFIPFFRTSEELNGFPVFVQSIKNGLSEQRTLAVYYHDASATLLWQIRASNVIVALSNSEPTTTNPFDPSIIWLMFAYPGEDTTSDVIPAQLTVSCSACSYERSQQCAQFNMICEDGGGIVQCVCDETMGLVKNLDGTCSSNVPRTITISGFRTDSFNNLYTQIEDFPPTYEVAGTVIAQKITFLFPDLWILKISSSDISVFFAFKVQRTLDFALISEVLEYSSNTRFSTSTISVEAEYCSPLEDCGPNFKCHRPMANSPLNCQCDDFGYALLDGECVKQICPELHVSGFHYQFAANGVYLLTQQLINGYPVFESAQNTTFWSIYVENGNWHFGEVDKRNSVAHGAYFKENPSEITQWIGADTSFGDQFLALKCRYCDFASCQNDEQCIYSNVSNALAFVDIGTCGCPPHTIMVNGTCVLPEDTFCPTIQVVAYFVRIGGFYEIDHYDERNYAVYKQRNAPFFTLSFHAETFTWQLYRVDFFDANVIRAWCVKLENSHDVSNCDDWVFSNPYNGRLMASQYSFLTCTTCSLEQRNVCNDTRQECVVVDRKNDLFECQCGPGHVIGDITGTFEECTPIETVCDAIESVFSVVAFYNAALYRVGIINQRPAYEAAYDLVRRQLPALDFSSSGEWRFTIGDVVVAKSSSVDATIAGAWQVSRIGTYQLDPTGHLKCSKCRPSTCGVDTSMSCSASPTSTLICQCPEGTAFDDVLGACKRVKPCNIVVFVQGQYAGYLTTTTSPLSLHRPVYMGSLFNGNKSESVSFMYHPKLFWQLQSTDGDSLFFVNFISDTWSPTLSNGRMLSIVPSIQKVFPFFVSKVELFCDQCEDVLCPPTKICQTTRNGSACICEAGNILFEWIGNETICQPHSFATMPKEILYWDEAISIRFGTVLTIVPNDHINKQYYYKSTSQSAFQIFFQPNAFMDNGAWVLGAVGSFSLPNEPTASLLGAKFGAFSIEAICDTVLFSAQQSAANSITISFGNEVTTNVTVRISTDVNFPVDISTTTYAIIPGTHSFTIDELLATRMYYLQTFVKTTMCVEYPSELQSVFLPTAAPSSPPRNIVVTNVDMVSFALQFDMLDALSSNGAVISYTIRYAPTGEPTMARTLSTTSRSVTVSNLQPGSSYLVSVAASTSAAQGPFSPPLLVSTADGLPIEPTINSIALDMLGRIVAAITLPNLLDRNGQLTLIRFTCMNQETQEVFVVDFNITSTSVYFLGTEEVLGTTINCGAAISTSAGFGPSSSTKTLVLSTATSKGRNNSGVIIGVIFCVFIVLAVVGYLFYRHLYRIPVDIFTELEQTTTNPTFVLSKYSDVFEGMYMFGYQLELIKDLGEGEFGSVHLAKTDSLPLRPKKVETLVAVKYMKEVNDIDELELFMKEAARMQPLQHPHVVRLLAVSSLSSLEQFIVLENLPGGDLLSHLEDVRPSRTSQGLSFGIQLSYCSQICDGLAYLGNVNYVHRDLAARNILLTSGLAMKIGDFGMARSIHNSSYYSPQGGKAKIPVRWMSPESMLQNKYTHLSDVYSFGVIMFEIFTYGAFPWDNYEDMVVVAELRKGNHMPLDAIDHRLHEHILDCWKPVAERPRADEVLEKIKVWSASRESNMIKKSWVPIEMYQCVDEDV